MVLTKRRFSCAVGDDASRDLNGNGSYGDGEYHGGKSY